ncbi:MAG: TolB family protein [Gaiellaceae bacterium]
MLKASPRFLAFAGALVFAIAMPALGLSASSAATGLILYSQEVGGKVQLFTVRPDGTSRTQITRGAAQASRGEWSPNGRLIAFERIAPDESRAAVATMNADGTGVRELTPTGYQGDPSFTPDGRWIVFTRNPKPSDNGIWIMKVDGSNPRRLSRNPFMQDGNCGCDEDATVSPDGKRVTFVRYTAGERQHALFSVGIDGRGLKQLTPYELAVDAEHDWSPDGKRIVLTMHAPPDGTRSANVVTIRSNGSDLRWVTRFKGGTLHAWAGSYSPDGKWLAVRIQGGGKDGVYVVRPDGTGLRRIATLGLSPSTIDWSPGR